jgi:perosamine synthetase
MVLTNDDRTASLLRKLRNQGNSETVRYFHDLMGFNFRMTNIQAAIGCAQMERLDAILARKSEIQDLYEKNLGEAFTFQRVGEGCQSSRWMVSLMARDPEIRDRVMRDLEGVGIETRPFFRPVNRMPFYSTKVKCPVTEAISSRGFNLPSYHLLRNEEVLDICNEVNNIAGVLS